MTDRTYRLLSAKARELKEAMDIKSVEFGHDDSTDGFFVELTGKRGDRVGKYRAHFDTIQALHRYFNDKIFLFQSSKRRDVIAGRL